MPRMFIFRQLSSQIRCFHPVTTLKFFFHGSTIKLTMLCRYYHNITSNTLVVLEAMAAHNVKTLIYSSTCATYGEPVKMPIREETPQASFCFTQLLFVLD